MKVSCLGVLMFFSMYSQAAIFNVNVTVQDNVDVNPGDGICSTISSGDFCTLRAAVMEANANPGTDIIILPGNNAEISLSLKGSGNNASSGDLDIKESVVIGTYVVPNDELPTINALQLNNRVFDIRPGVDLVTFQNFIIRGGVSANGGAIYIRDGVDEVNITRVKFTENIANTDGGAIYNIGSTLIIEDSSFISNTALNDGAAIYEDCGDTDIKKTTFANNSGHLLLSHYTSSIHYTKNASLRTFCQLSVTNSTISGVETGAGIYVLEPSLAWPMNLVLVGSSLLENMNAIRFNADTELSMANTLFANNALFNCVLDTAVGVGLANLTNLDDGNSCSSLLGGLSLTMTNPELEPLQLDAVNWHQYAVPQAASVVVDGGSITNCPQTDQRGQMRPVDGDEDGGSECDIGAIERVPNPWLFKDSFED
ncbi:MAG: choice-of-anchor Q domain-containing protein [bacterium]